MSQHPGAMCHAAVNVNHGRALSTSLGDGDPVRPRDARNMKANRLASSETIAVGVEQIPRGEAIAMSPQAASTAAVLALSTLGLAACGGGSSPAAPPAPLAPAAPSGVTATPGNNQVALVWTASTGATGYSIARATSQRRTLCIDRRIDLDVVHRHRRREWHGLFLRRVGVECSGLERQFSLRHGDSRGHVAHPGRALPRAGRLRWIRHRHSERAVSAAGHPGLDRAAVCNAGQSARPIVEHRVDAGQQPHLGGVRSSRACKARCGAS